MAKPDALLPAVLVNVLEADVCDTVRMTMPEDSAVEGALVIIRYEIYRKNPIHFQRFEWKRNYEQHGKKIFDWMASSGPMQQKGRPSY